MTPAPRQPLAIVTGASSGIGRCTAIELARAGYRTVLIARRAHLLEDLAARISPFAPSVALPMDLAEVHAIAPAMHALFAKEGPPSVLINNAGFGVYSPFMDQSPDVLLRLLRVNHLSHLELTRAALPGLLTVAERGGLAHVMNVASCAARMGPWGHAGYAASKAAMQAATEALAAEFSARRVRFTTVYPGIIDTPYFEKPAMRPLWSRVRRHAIPPERVATAVVARLGRPGVTLYVPCHFRLLNALVAVSPTLAHRLVASRSRPSRAEIAGSAGQAIPVPATTVAL